MVFLWGLDGDLTRIKKSACLEVAPGIFLYLLLNTHPIFITKNNKYFLTKILFCKKMWSYVPPQFQ